MSGRAVLSGHFVAIGAHPERTAIFGRAGARRHGDLG